MKYTVILVLVFVFKLVLGQQTQTYYSCRIKSDFTGKLYHGDCKAPETFKAQESYQIIGKFKQQMVVVKDNCQFLMDPAKIIVYLVTNQRVYSPPRMPLYADHRDSIIVDPKKLKINGKL